PHAHLRFRNMSQIVEINLKIPSLTIPGQKDRTNNELVRFTKLLELSSIPKSGEVLDVTAGSDTTLPCVVVRSTWDAGKDCFIIECQYAKRSIPASDYGALVGSMEWTVRSLG